MSVGSIWVFGYVGMWVWVRGCAGVNDVGLGVGGMWVFGYMVMWVLVCGYVGMWVCMMWVWVWVVCGVCGYVGMWVWVRV